MKSGSPRPCIVLVEDDRALLGALTFALELEGYEVRAFETAEAALAGDLDAACLVVDFRLPDANGLELLRQVRSNGAQTPAILITSLPEAPVKLIAASLGVHIIEKPLLSDDLVDAVLKLAPIPGVRPARGS